MAKGEIPGESYSVYVTCFGVIQKQASTILQTDK
jgi:hypothetical protein